MHKHPNSSGAFCGICHPELLKGVDVDDLQQQAQEAKTQRAADMPDEASALVAMHRAFTRLKELGWQEAIYCPKDGTQIHLIEPGSTGIHTGYYKGEWPHGGWWIEDGETWPSRPCLFRDIPTDHAAPVAEREG